MSEVERFEVVAVGDVADVLAVLVDRLGLVVEVDEHVARRRLDSADRRLADVGVVLEHRSTSDGTADLVWIREGRAVHRIVGVALEPPADATAARLPVRLATVAGAAPFVTDEPVHSRLVSLSRLDDEDKTTVRVVVDDTPVGIDPSPVLIEVVGLRGYRSDADRLVAELHEHLDVRATTRSSVERSAPRSTGPSITGSMAAIEGWRMVLRRLTTNMNERFVGVLSGRDPEDLHAFRVAVRRIRTLLREGRAVLPPDERARFRAEFLWLGDVTTPTRDADVLVADHPRFVVELGVDHQDWLAPMLEVFWSHRAEVQMQMANELRSIRRIEFGAAWAAWLEDDSRWTTSAAADAGRPLAEVAAASVRDAHAEVVRTGRRIRKSSPPSVLHDLRKDAKRLRYLLESFAPVFDPDGVSTMAEPLRRLQDALGTFQDDAVQAGAVHDLMVERDDVGPDVMIATESVIEHLERTSRRARAQSRRAFEEFDDRQVRRAVERLVPERKGSKR
ncbi:MAG: CHAD domain-containing protein [Acidimicrobiia bacterium]|nr:CHAD domain-containing protein [Acidimicrobiia bacterium]